MPDVSLCRDDREPGVAMGAAFRFGELKKSPAASRKRS